MAGKKNMKKAGGMRRHFEPDKEKTAAEYYELHTGAVNDLVEADESNSPEISPQELAKYRSGGKIHIPEKVQVLFLKAWFAGAVCFFFFWGLGMYVPNLIDMLFIVGLVMGFVTDLMVNVILRYFEKTPGANDRWMMFPKKGYASLVLNVLYSYLILFFVFTLYNVINLMIISATGAEDTVPLGVEPILFGLFWMMFDQMFITMKHLLKRIVSDASKRQS